MISRIKQLLDWQQLSPTQFADRIGIGRPVVSHILNERNKPSLEVVQRILAAFPELSIAWLLNGAGEMLAGATTAPAVPVAPAAPAAAASLPVPAPDPVALPAPTDLPVAAPRFGAAELSPVAVASSAPAPPRPTPPAPRPPIARFSAGPQGPVSSPAAADEAPAAVIVAAPVAVPVAEMPPVPATVPPALASPAPAPTPVALAPAPGPVPAAAAFAEVLAEPGKAIRRIVIFYRDGSFADYQPEG